MKNSGIRYAALMHTPWPQPGIARTAMLLLLSMFVVACSSSGSGTVRPDDNNPANRILACKSTDRQISGPDQCLQDDAACYEIANGGWCTGPRGNICPAGSQALPANSVCPAGSRCFRISESLECFIQG